MTSKFPRKSDVRMHASTLFVCLALIYGIDLSTPGLLDRAGHIKGTDFLQFYIAGSLALNGPAAALYDHKALADLSVKLVPESRGVYYLPVYGPQVSLLFAPFAMVPYAWALLFWILTTALIYGLCCAAIWKTCPNLHNEGLTTILLAAACPAFFFLVAHGQNSAIALACLTAAFFALRHQKPLLAGLAIGTLIYKPQLGIVFACVFVLNLEWRIVAGAMLGAAAQLGAAWLHYGKDVMNAHWQWVRRLGEISPLLDVKPYQMHSLLSFWKYLVPWENVAISIYVVSAVVVIFVAWWVWRAAAPLALRYSFLLLATVLVNPHLYVYDLVILAPALLMSADWALGHPEEPFARPIQRMLYLSYALPLAGVATQFTRVQASVVAMTALSGMIAWVVLQSSGAQARASTVTWPRTGEQVC